MKFDILLLRIANIYEEIGLKGNKPDDAVGKAKDLVFILAGVVLLYVILSAGFKYVTSGGNSESTKKAGQTMLFGAIGFVIILLSYTIITWVFKVGGS